MTDIKCYKCIRLFDSDLQIIRLDDNRFMSVNGFSISFEGHIQLEGSIIGFIDYNGNIQSKYPGEEIKVFVCRLILNDDDISKFNLKFNSLQIK